jgi:hypothetical protein
MTLIGRFLTPRRSEWLPGVAVLAAAVGIGSLLGVSIGSRSWALYLGLIVAALLAIGWLERLLERRRRQAPPTPRARGKLKVIRGGKTGYDLEKDRSTDDQKYVM